MGTSQRRSVVPSFHSTWSAPSLDTLNGRPRIFFAGGNGVLYSFELRRRETQPLSDYVLQNIFTFDFDPSAPKHDVHSYLSNRREGPSDFYSMPVFYQNRIFHDQPLGCLVVVVGNLTVGGTGKSIFTPMFVKSTRVGALLVQPRGDISVAYADVDNDNVKLAGTASFDHNGTFFGGGSNSTKISANGLVSLPTQFLPDSPG